MSQGLVIRATKNNVPTLFLIATPIGNLKDITLRAIETLKSVDIIYAEDTRVTKKLLDYYNISKPLISYHKFNEHERISEIKEHLENGLNVGFCSDAGMPVISDPGYLLVSNLKAEFNVVIIPGVTSTITALAGSGIAADKFSFLGFIDKKKTAKIKMLESYKNLEQTLIFFEVANRLFDTINTMYEIYGNRRCVIARELTKLYETYYEFNLGDDISNVTLKGEFVIIVEGYQEKTISDMEIIKNLQHLLTKNKTLKEAILITSESLNINKNKVYDLALKHKLNKE